MTAVAALMAPPRALANPTGGVVVDGAATISSAGSVTNVTQSTSRAIINWLTFSIATGETVNFVQPSALSVTLNRVVGNEQSVIAGALNANGRVFLINSNGILFTKDAQVNVGGLVASTLDISNSNFMAGNYTFSGPSAAAVVNRGTINAADGGYVALLGRTVSNEGTINAKLGAIALASGDQITLNFGGDSLLDVTIDKGTYDALVENKGLIRADGGQVVMTARAADAVLSAQVNNSGVVQARAIADLTGGSSSSGGVKIGKIKMLASGGTVKVSGKLDASAPNGGKAGTIETSGNKVTIADSAVVTTASSTGETGAWTIDPDGFTIGTGGDITGALLGSQLANNNITVLSTSGGGTDGNINVSSAVSWSGNTILTLNATNNIDINAPITATGASAGLVMNYGGFAATGRATSGTGYSIDSANGASVTLSGASSSLKINGVNYTLIHSMAGLEAFASVTATGAYALAQDLDASGKTYGTSVVGTLTGTLAGLGHTISNLTINYTAAGSFTGLIGTLGSSSATAATVRDIGLLNAKVTSNGTISGTLVGIDWGTVSNSYATGTLIGAGTVGGLVGRNQFGFVTNSWASVNTSGLNNVGGLVGLNLANSATNGVISNSHATGTITPIAATTSRTAFGGLVGSNTGGAIKNSYATGNVVFGAQNTAAGTNSGGVVDGSELGGLVGVNTNNSSIVGAILNSYATGDVSGPGNYLGGLLGFNNTGRIDSSYATGNVTGSVSNGSTNVGGLAGANTISTTFAGAGQITNSRASGNVFGYSIVGGLVGGSNSGTISASSATGNVTAQTTAGGLVGSNGGTISGSAASGNVTATNLGGAGTAGGNAGGLVGTNGGAIINSTASGSVTGTTNVGGLVGASSSSDAAHQASISDSSSTGSVNGVTNVGGLVGSNLGAVSNSRASGDVSGTTAVGGLIGSNSNISISVGTVTNSSATGSVNAGGGSLIGSNTSTGAVTNSTYRDAKAEARAAARLAATRQAALSAGNVVSSAAEAASKRSPNAQASASAGKAAVSAAAGANIDDNLQGETPAQTSLPTQRPRVRHASATGAGGGQKAHVSSPGAGYRARIRSIDVDGRHFDLGGGGGNNAPDQKAQ